MEIDCTKRYAPTRIARYCCEVFKETANPNRLICTGVRWDESNKRKSRGVFEIRGKNAKDIKKFTLAHTKEVFQESKDYGEGNEPNAYDCKLIENAKKNNDIICNPIIDWTDEMVWLYIHSENIPFNDLYKPPYNYTRCGCIGCPMANNKKELEDFPEIKKRYLKAFEDMVRIRQKKGLVYNGKYQTAEEWFNWWIGN